MKIEEKVDKLMRLVLLLGRAVNTGTLTTSTNEEIDSLYNELKVEDETVPKI